MEKSIFYNNMHVAGEDMDQIYLDTEQQMEDHIYDFHDSSSQYVVADETYGATSAQVLAQTSPSLTLEIQGGVAYQNQKRIEIEEIQEYTITSPPSTVGGLLNISRIDLIYLTLTTIDKYPFSVDFIDANRNITQSTVYTRSGDTYTINQLQGIYNPAGASKPAIPADGVALAYIHLRDATNKIYDADTNSLNEGYIEDARTIIYTTIRKNWVSAPAAATSTGITGDEAYDSDYYYLCVTTNTWKRVAISTW